MNIVIWMSAWTLLMAVAVVAATLDAQPPNRSHPAGGEDLTGWITDIGLDWHDPTNAEHLLTWQDSERA